MPLTERQQRIAQMPYSYTSQDLVDVMYILGDPVEWKVFGDLKYKIVFQLYTAAKSRRHMNIPIDFEREIQSAIRINGPQGIIKPHIQRFGFGDPSPTDT